MSQSSWIARAARTAVSELLARTGSRSSRSNRRGAPQVEAVEPRQLFAAAPALDPVTIGATGTLGSGGGVPSMNNRQGTAASADGRFVVFFTEATNVVPGVTDANNSADVFIRDRVAGTTQLISHAAGSPMTTGTGGHSYSPTISADGRYVAFGGAATNLVAGQVDTNGRDDVFVWDRLTDTTALVSHAAGSPATAGDGWSDQSPVISADGNFVAYGSASSNLVAGQVDPVRNPNNDPEFGMMDMYAEWDVFLYDRAAGTNAMVSRAAGTAATAANETSRTPVVSGDGRYVAYASEATNLAAGQVDGNNVTDVFLFDAVAGTTTLVSHAAGSPSTAGQGTGSGAPDISADGGRVAYMSSFTNLVPGQVDAPTSYDAFVWTRATDATDLVTRVAGTAATAAGGSLGQVVVSADGNYVAYGSTATNLVPGQVDNNAGSMLGGGDLFLFDVAAGTSVLVTHAYGSAVTTADMGTYNTPAVSPDGRYVAYANTANNLVAGMTVMNGTYGEDLFLFDRDAGTNVLASHAAGSDLTGGTGNSSYPSFSRSGNTLVFRSASNNLVAGDTNGREDTFAYPLVTGPTLTASSNPVAAGNAVILTATVPAANGATPTGTVDFMDGATLLATVPLDGAGVATLTTSALTVGPHTLTIEYAGDNNNPDATSAPLELTIAPAPAAVAVTVPSTPAVAGQTVGFSAAVTSAYPGTPTGLVTFYAGGAWLGSAPVGPDGTAAVTAALGSDTHAVYAIYTGDATYTGAISAPVNYAVAQAGTTVTLTAPAAATVYGQPATFTAAVAAVAPGGGVPTGVVTFYNGLTPLGSAPIDGSGVATFTTSALPVGPVTVTAEYGGSNDYLADTDAAAHEVAQAGSAVSLTPAPSPSVFGQSVTLTAVVAAVAPGGGTPTGSVTFYDGATPIGAGTLDGTGTATLTTAALATGSHALTAVYDGDTNFTASSSAGATFAVNRSAAAATVSVAPGTSVFGQAVTLTATVAAAAPGAGLPTGTVEFFDGATSLGTAAVDADGVATLSAPLAAVGARAVTAAYAGDGNFQPATSAAATPTVAKAATTVAVTTSGSPAYPGQPVTFTAAVSVAAPGAGAPTGTVTFFVNGEPAATVAVGPDGTAAFTTDSLPEATHLVAASYGGDARFLSAGSPTLTQVVENWAPVALPIPAVSVFEDAAPTAIDLGTYFDDHEQPDDELSFTVTGYTNHPLFDAVSVDGQTLTLAYAADAFGTANVTVRATDGRGKYAETTIAVTVTSVNDAPSFYIAADPSVQEDSGTRTIGGFATDISRGPANEAGQTLAFVVTNDRPELFTTQPRIAPNGALTFAPAPNANGSATVSVRLTDNGGTANGGSDSSEVQTFSLTINAVPDAPVAGNDAVVTDEDTPATGNVLANDSDADGDALTAALVSGPAHGTLVLNPNGSFTYTPAADYHGPDAFAYRASDGGRTSNLATVSVTVTSVLDGGTVGFAAATYSTAESGGTLTLTVARAGGAEGAATVGFAVTGGTATNGTDYTLTSGTVSFADGQTLATIDLPVTDDAASEPAETVVVTLSGPAGTALDPAAASTTVTIADDDNAVPTAGPVAVTRAPGAAVVADVLAAAADADGDPLTVSIAAQPEHGTATVEGGTVRYTPAAGAHAADSFQYTVSDGRGGTATATVDVAVAGVGLDTNPADPSKVDLVVVGTDGNDDVRITGAHGPHVKVSVNGTNLGSFRATGRVIAYGLDGDDAVTAKNTARAALFYGGNGNDVLRGSNGPDVLVGGDGDDDLAGGANKDVLVGGAGRDVLRGNAGDDLLVAGATAYDAAPDRSARDSLEAVFAAWAGPGTLAQRVALLGGTATIQAKVLAAVGTPAGPRLAADTIAADADADDLVDTQGKNWLIGDDFGDLLRGTRGGAVTRLN